MSELRVSRRFTVEAPPDRVWGYLTDPSLVVTCLPGAALSESSDDGLHHAGSVTVKLGAFSVSYRGSADFVEVDGDARRLRVTGKGREKTGAGAVSMSMVAQVVQEGGGSEVHVDGTFQLAGKIVSFGRGMIDAVTEEIFTAFAACLSSRLADAGDAEGAGDAGDARDGKRAKAPGDAAAPVGLALLLRALWRWLTGLFRRSGP